MTPEIAIQQVKQNGGKAGKIIGFTMGVLIFGLSVYAFSLSIKVNRLSLRKLKDEGYK
jgi:hypothetical protein